jgi:hypothetical protein
LGRVPEPLEENTFHVLTLNSFLPKKRISNAQWKLLSAWQNYTDRHRGQLSVNISFQDCLFDPATNISPATDLNVWMKTREQEKVGQPAAGRRPERVLDLSEECVHVSSSKH